MYKENFESNGLRFNNVRLILLILLIILFILLSYHILT